MHSRDYRDMIGGLLLMFMGAGAACYAWTSYPTGTLRQMGPGLYPTWLGVILFGLGVLVLVPAMRRTGPRLPKPQFRPLLAITGGGLAFALSIDRFGIIPAVMLLTVLCVLANNKLRLPATLALAIGLSVFSLLIFQVGLSIPVHAFRWPF